LKLQAVRRARKAMAKQMAALMMSQWDQHRHSTSCLNLKRASVVERWRLRVLMD
jgi:hypothetical protein